jgi:NADPH-dependent curcumin reductase CurA
MAAQIARIAGAAGWLDRGELACQPEVHEGFDDAPRAFLRLFNGAGTGKQLLRL